MLKRKKKKKISTDVYLLDELKLDIQGTMQRTRFAKFPFCTNAITFHGVLFPRMRCFLELDSVSLRFLRSHTAEAEQTIARGAVLRAIPQSYEIGNALAVSMMREGVWGQRSRTR